VPNLPHYFEEGPFVLKDYSFGCYYGGHQVPRVVSRMREHYGGAVLPLNLPVRDVPEEP
jgi:hypothetical protein